MNKIVPLVLWLLVLACGGVVIYLANVGSDGEMVFLDASGQPASSQTGIAFSDVKWEYLQNIPPFQFTNQDNENFDSANVNGRPMVVSFFFATCPTICRDLNRQIQTLREQLNDSEMMFTTISVHPENDTPEILKRYAADFDATPDDWNFLTGEMYRVKQLGSQAFNVSVDRDTHTDNILLVDRWGRYRDRFKWDDPNDMKRFLKVAKDVLAEQQPPFGKIIHTRNVLAGVKPPEIDSVPWIREFHLTDQNDQPFFSRQLIGQAWICNFFFVSCPGICVEQTQYIAGLQKRLKGHPAQIVSITTDPNHDNPQRLNEYARKMDADLESWTFLTGDETLIERTSAEYFKAYSSGGHHSTLLFVVDRWGNVRGEFDWREAAAEIQMVDLIDQLNEEKTPPAKFERISIEKEAEPEESGSGH